jgi:co-chaperonin GroES (HSP10)
MSYSWTDNCFQSGNVGQTDLQNMENNFAALKSLFESTGTPSNAVAGMPWFDSSTGILKFRNSANNAWKSLLDIDSGYAIDCGRTISAGTGLTGGGQLTANRTLSHAAHTGDVTGTGALTLANDTVKHAKIERGTLVLFSNYDNTEYDQNTNFYVTVLTQHILIPTSGAGTLRFNCRARVVSGSAGTVKINVNAVDSAETSINTGSFATYSCTLDISALTANTIYPCAIIIYANSGTTIRMQGHVATAE